MSRPIRISSAVVLAMLFVIPVLAEDWPSWRGNNLDSVSNERNLPNSFAEKNRLWQLKMPGPGGASPIVWKNQIFVASVDGNDLVLLCVGTDGQIQWKQTLEGQNVNIRMDRSNSASPSPVTDGKHVWVMLTNGILHCFSMQGDLQWKKDMQEEYGKFRIQFGMTSTPILDRGRLYFQFIHGSMRNDLSSKGLIVALNADTGEEIWTHIRLTEAVMENKHAYTSPTIFRNQDREFLIVHGADYATGHSLKDGSEIWRIGGLNSKSSYNDYLRFVSSPVCSKKLIVVPSAKSGPVIAFKPEVEGIVEKNDERIVWRLPRGTPDVATPLISKDRVYLARENGVVICLDARTGEQLYEERLLQDKHRSTPVAADGKIYLVGRDGTAVVLADGPEFKLLSQTDLGEDTTASPAISNGRIYIRTNKSLIAFGAK